MFINGNAWPAGQLDQWEQYAKQTTPEPMAHIKPNIIAIYP